MTRRDLMLYWWPVISRLAGLGIAIYETGWDSLDRPSLLALAAGLTIAPEVAGQQIERNRRRTLKRKGRNS